jgi:uncharacterized membrane protein YqiK
VGNDNTTPRWFLILVVAAVIVGVLVAFWLFAYLSAPALPQ